MSAPNLTREAWLELGVEALKPLFKERCEIDLPTNVKVTMSFPYNRKAEKIAGQCLHKDMSTGGKIEILINPMLKKPLEIMETLAHELIHAYDKNEHGHGGPFIRIGGKLGFIKPWKSTPATPELKEKLNAIIASMPAFPHDHITGLGAKKKKQTTRMLKLICSNEDCTFACRAAGTPLLECGVPSHCDFPMTVILPEEPSE